jgi:hypothetical protein
MISVELANHRVRRNRQKTKAQQQQHDVEDPLTRWSQAERRQVRVQVAHQQGALKKHQAGGPDSGGTAESWKNQFGEQRLQEKQQKRAQENRER